MFDRFLHASVALLFPVICFASIQPAVAQNDMTVEPALEYQLIINGDSHTITDNKEVDIVIDQAGSASVKLVPNNYRVFPYGGMEFRYPAAFEFTTDHDADSLTWSLDSPSVGFMLFVFPNGGLSKEDFASSVADSFMEAGTDEVQVTLGRTVYDGIRIRADVDGEVYVQTIIELDTDDGGRLILLQDFFDDSGQHSEEYNRMVSMIGTSLVIEGSWSDGG